jgi:hypothetical protein
MRFLRLLLCVPVIYIIALIGATPVSSCTKTNTVRDTTNIIVRDTVIIHDTTIIK